MTKLKLAREKKLKTVEEVSSESSKIISDEVVQEPPSEVASDSLVMDDDMIDDDHDDDEEEDDESNPIEVLAATQASTEDEVPPSVSPAEGEAATVRSPVQPTRDNLSRILGRSSNYNNEKLRQEDDGQNWISTGNLSSHLGRGLGSSTRSVLPSSSLLQ